MWNPGKYFQREVNDPDDKRRWLFRDKLQFGQVFTPYKEFDHPQFGKVLIGGLNKWSSRVTPTFMLEEECHRNFAFTMYHADQMPVIRFDRVEVAREKGGAWVLTAEIRNDKLMPTRSGIARQKGIGRVDLMTCEVPDGGAVVASGFLTSWLDTRIDPVKHEPARIQMEGGIPGRSGVIFRFYITGPEGGKVRLRYDAEKARVIEREVELKASKPA
jgi:hypothetical protein